ncbi:MAG: hypothetical protein Q8M95_04970 [Candidatus Methanoperedens sp.]|nr:hypothetical protein [Candidatus Methanoperedens sp.]
MLDWNVENLKEVRQDIENGAPHLRENVNASDFEVVSGKVYMRKKDSKSDTLQVQ